MTATLAKPREAISLKAVHDDDLVAYLERLGVRAVDGVIGKCKFCGDAVTTLNLAAIFPLSGSLKVVCERPECLRGVQQLISDGELSL
jgi:hypothetical protein